MTIRLLSYYYSKLGIFYQVMDNLMRDDDDTDMLISQLISDGIDAGDELINFMEATLADDSNLTDKASSPTPREQENNITDENLCMLINELKKTHTAKMMFFTAEQETKFYNANLWRAFIVSEKTNVGSCSLSRITQLSFRIKKLAELVTSSLFHSQKIVTIETRSQQCICYLVDSLNFHINFATCLLL